MDEHSYCLIAILISAISLVLIGIYNEGMLLKWFPDAGFVTTAQVWSKYPISFVTNKYHRTLMRFMIFFGQLVCFSYLNLHTKWRRVFGNSFYISTIILNTAANIWLYTFSVENLMASLVMVVFCALGAQYRFIYACLRGLPNDHECSRTKFRWFILEPLGYITIYCTWTVATSSAGAFTYENSFGAEVARPGMFSSTTSHLIGVTYLAVIQTAWTVFDLWLYPQCTQDVRLVYPGIIFTLGGMFCQSYNPAKGLTFPLAASVVLIVMASLAMWRKATAPDHSPKVKAP